MSKAVFEFYTVISNSSQHPNPRIFFIKRKDSKIIWSIEIEEQLQEFRHAEFDIEEADFWGVLVRIQDEMVVLDNDGEEFVLFDEKITWGIETLFSHKHAVGRSGGLIYPCRWTPPEKFKKDERWLEVERKYMKQLEAGIASPNGNMYDFQDSSPKRRRERNRARE